MLRSRRRTVAATNHLPQFKKLLTAITEMLDGGNTSYFTELMQGRDLNDYYDFEELMEDLQDLEMTLGGIENSIHKAIQLGNELFDSMGEPED